MTSFGRRTDALTFFEASFRLDFTLSELPFLLRRRPSRGKGRDLGRLPGSLEVMADGGGIGDRGNHLHLAAAMRTFHVDLENSCEQGRPAEPVFTGCGILVVRGFAGLLAGGYNLVSTLGVRCQNTMISNDILARRGYQSRKLFDYFHR